MRVRLITGNSVGGKFYVRSLGCHKCFGDVWDWEESQPAMFDTDNTPRTINTLYCDKCREKILVEEGRFLFEATNEKNGWFAGKHKK